jgi:diguanylate cyclase (GGDEF)-like protein/PAS domain S-box-containing protein
LRDAVSIDLRGDDAVVILDLTGRLVGADDAAGRLLGLESSELLGRGPDNPAWRMVGTDGRLLGSDEDPVAQALATGEPVAQHVVGVELAAEASGRFAWVEVAAYPIRASDGHVEGTATTLRDVSDSLDGRRATASVLTSMRALSEASVEDEARFRLLAENSADVVFQVDVAGACVWVSPSVHEVLGWDADALLGTSLSPLLHPDDREVAHERRLAALGDGRNGVDRLELRYATAAGGWRWMSVLSRPLRDAAGTVVGGLTALRDIQDEVERREELRYLAGHDGLTGLLNREAALRALDRAVARARDTERWVGVLFVDVDHFKDVNDTHGHQAGDRLLVEVGHRITAALRDTDVVARLGGDEFLVILTSLREPVNAEKRAQALLAAVSDDDSGGLPETTVSIGLVTDDGHGDPAQILADADAALYRAKNAGRNRVST